MADNYLTVDDPNNHISFDDYRRAHPSQKSVNDAISILQRTKQKVNKMLDQSNKQISSLLDNVSDDKMRAHEMHKKHEVEENTPSQDSDNSKKSGSKKGSSSSSTLRRSQSSSSLGSKAASDSTGISGSYANKTSPGSMITSAEASQMNPASMALAVLGNRIDVLNSTLQSDYNAVQATNNQLANCNNLQNQVRALQQQLPAAGSSDADSKSVTMSSALQKQLNALLPSGVVPTGGKCTSSQLSNISSALTGLAQNYSNQNDQASTTFQMTLNSYNAAVTQLTNILASINTTKQAEDANLKE